VVAEGGGGLGVVCGGGEFADVGEDVGGGAGGAAQVLGVESGDGGLDAGWEVAGVVVQDLGEPVPGVEGAGGGGPQRPDVVAGPRGGGCGPPTASLGAGILWFPPNRGGLLYAASRSGAAVFS